jgi:hypothetical protein
VNDVYHHEIQVGCADGTRYDDHEHRAGLHHDDQATLRDTLHKRGSHGGEEARPHGDGPSQENESGGDIQWEGSEGTRGLGHPRSESQDDPIHQHFVLASEGTRAYQAYRASQASHPCCCHHRKS